jgi:hypothetical protein
MTMAHLAVSEDLVKNLSVNGVSGWYQHYGIDISDNFLDDPVNVAKHNLINRIICIQVSCYLLTRLSYLADGQPDTVYEMLNELKNEYLTRYGEKYPDPNKDVNF